MSKQAPMPGAPGAATPAAAVDAFLAAAKAEDLQAMSAVWGTPTGSVRDQIPRDELDKREIYIIRCSATTDTTSSAKHRHAKDAACYRFS